MATHRCAPEQSRITFACARLPGQLAASWRGKSRGVVSPSMLRCRNITLLFSCAGLPAPALCRRVSAPAPSSGRIVCICALLQAADRFGDGVAALSHVLEVRLARSPRALLLACCRRLLFTFSVPPHYKAAECNPRAAEAGIPEKVCVHMPALLVLRPRCKWFL